MKRPKSTILYSKFSILASILLAVLAAGVLAPVPAEAQTNLRVSLSSSSADLNETVTVTVTAPSVSFLSSARTATLFVVNSSGQRTQIPNPVNMSTADPVSGSLQIAITAANGFSAAGSYTIEAQIVDGATTMSGSVPFQVVFDASNLNFTVSVPNSTYRGIVGGKINIPVTVSTNLNIKAGDVINLPLAPDRTIVGFYAASVGTGATQICSTTGCNFEEFEPKTSPYNPTPSFTANFQLDLTSGGRYPVGTRGISFFPVLGISLRTDFPLSNQLANVTIQVFPDQPAFNAAATAAGQTPAQFAAGGGPTTANTAGTTGSSLVSTWANILGGGLISLVNGILTIIVGILRWIIWLIATLIIIPLLEVTLSIDAANISSTIFFGWSLVRDIVNMIFILILIILGFATILKIESYNYRKILVELIIMAILVNFSLVIGRIIIQIADVVQFTFLPQTDGINGVRELFKVLILDQTKIAINGLSLSAAGALAGTMSILFQFVLELGVVITFAALAIYTIIRIIALWFLLILSPFAYALRVLPATQHQASEWWSHFLKYAFFTPIMAFFLRMAIELHSKGLAITQGRSFGSAPGTPPPNVQTFLANNGVLDAVPLSVSIELFINYIVVLAFMWGGIIVASKMSIIGADAVTSVAKKGLGAPFAYGWKGIKMGTGALAGLGAEKFLERTGIEIRPTKWKEGWIASREKSREAREAKGAAKALDRKSALASPVTFFQRYWNKEGLERVAQGGDKEGRRLLDDAKKLKDDAKKLEVPGKEKIDEANGLRVQASELQKEAEGKTGFERTLAEDQAKHWFARADQLEQEANSSKEFSEAKEKRRQARLLEAQGKKLIAPADYFTQQKVRAGMEEELKTIHTDNWHELVDLFEGAKREGKPLRAAAILQHLTDTYNENELANSSQYTRKLEASESADGKEHQKDEFFEYSPAGMENFRKLIMEEQLGLGKEASMMLMSDVSDMAEKRNHFEIMRMYVSENGELRLKTPEERQLEVSAEKDKMSTALLLSNANRLAGSREVPDADYDITGKRTTYFEADQIAYYLKNFSAVKFLLNRGQINPSQAKAAGEKQNAELLINAAELLDDKEEVEPITGLKLRPSASGRNTRRQQYLAIMDELIHYGETKGLSKTGKSKVDEVREHFAKQGIQT